MLDAHAPHGRIHGWRDFLIHIVAIAIGLLLALGLEPEGLALAQGLLQLGLLSDPGLLERGLGAGDRVRGPRVAAGPARARVRGAASGSRRPSS